MPRGGSQPPYLVREPGGWPLTGRDAELAGAVAALRAAGGVLLVGAAGAGRTRLAREVAGVLAATGHEVVWALGSRAACDVPFGALLPLLIPDREPPSGVLGVADRLYRRFAVDSGRDQVLMVDDVHLLDNASAAVVHDVAARRRAHVVVTLVPHFTPPDAVSRLWTDRMCERVEVPPLTREDVGALVCGVLAGPVDVVSRRSLHRLSGGNLQLLSELLLAGVESGVLRELDGVWHWTGGDYVTERLVDAVRVGTDRLAPEVAPVLEVLAVVGHLSQWSFDELVGGDAVLAAERSGMIVPDHTGSRTGYRLRWPVIGEVIRARLPHARLRGIWRDLARVLGRTPMRRADDSGHLVAWQWRAGLPTSPQQLLEAARHAAGRGEYQEVELLCRAAAAGGEDGLAIATRLVRSVVGERRLARLVTRFAAMASGTPNRAAAVAARGYGIAAVDRPAPIVGVWAGMRGSVAALQGACDTARSFLHEAAVLLRDHDPFGLRGLFLAGLAGTYAVEGDCELAGRWSLEVRRCGAAHPVAAPWIQRYQAWLWAARGDVTRAAEVAVGAADLACRERQPLVEAILLFDAARFGRAQSVVDRLDRLAAAGVCADAFPLAAAARALARRDPALLEASAWTMLASGHYLVAAELATLAYRGRAAEGDRKRTNAALILVQRTRHLVASARTPLLDTVDVQALLTSRELQVARLAAGGVSSREIATRLRLSRRTVDNYLGSVYAKLGVSGRSELAEAMGSRAVDAAD